MDFDALKIRKMQNNEEKRELGRIVKYHYDKINSLISFHKKDKFILYAVEDFIPGFRNYNKKMVTDHIIKQLGRENYGVERFGDFIIKISWRLSNKDQLKKHVSNLLHSIYERIKDSIKDDQHHLIYEIPINFRYPQEKVKKLLVRVLKVKKFNIIEHTNSLDISW